MMLRIANSILAWIAAITVAIILNYRGTALIAVVFAGGYALTLNLTNYCRSFYRAFEDLRQEAGMLVIEKVLVVGGGFFLLLTTQLASWTLAGMAAGMSVATAANIWWTNRHFAKINFGLLSLPFMRRSLKIMIPFGLAGLFAVAYFRVDVVMIEAYLGEVRTGQYGAAFRILEALNMLPTIVAVAAVYPRLSRLYHEGSYPSFSGLLRKSLLGMVAVSLLITLPLMLLAGPIIHLLDPDPAYGPSVAALQILVWSFPFHCANGLFFAALTSMEQQRFVSIALGMAVLVNVGLNMIAIPAYGINGAAVATIVPEVLLVGIYTMRYRYGMRLAPGIDAQM
jgi:O-antigen/teichoic acid export membrane protein